MARYGAGDWLDHGSFDGLDPSALSFDVIDKYDDDYYYDDAAENETVRESRVRLFNTHRSDGWKKNVPSTGAVVTNMVIADKTIVLSTTEGKILRWMSGAPTEVMPVVRSPDERVHKLFVDPRGNHCLFSVISLGRSDPPQTYYLHSLAQAPEKLSKAVKQNAMITSVGWDKQTTKHKASRENSGPTLVGTQDGNIFEATFESKRGGAVTCKSFTLLWSIPDSVPIGGLQWETFPADQDKRFVMVATNPHKSSGTRVYQLVGGPSFKDLFASVRSDVSYDIISHDARECQLLFKAKHKGATSTTFALFTGAGIQCGQLQYGSQVPGDPVIAHPHTLKLPRRTFGRGVEETVAQPLSVAMTEFHFLVAYADALVAVSRVSEEVVWEEGVESKAGRYLGVTTDETTGHIWTYGEKAVYQVQTKHEKRDVWSLYLDKAMASSDGSDALFERALQLANTDAQRDKVATAQADYLFDSDQRERAAYKYAQTSRSFEEIALKFINANDNESLKAFLLAKLDTLSKTAKAQRTILCTWLTEIYLNDLNMLQTEDEPDISTHLGREVLARFQQFLTDNVEWLNEATTFHLISSHGRVQDLLFYAKLVKDYTRMLMHHMQHGDWLMALETLRDAPDDQAEELFYKFSPQLILVEPRNTVRAWKKATYLDPKKLIPALVRYTQAQEALAPSARDVPSHAMVYLDWQVLHGNTDQAIHNYLLSLLAKQDDTTDLLRFMQSQFQSGAAPVFDLKYALRVCTREGRDKACVFIYSAMGLYEEAVELALKVDVDLAKANAKMPSDPEMRKKLWLLVCHYVIEHDDVKAAIKLVQESDLVQIEDVLTFFPDFVTIEEFKNEITESLQSCNNRISELKERMQGYTESADRIRDDIKDLRNRYGVVRTNQDCEVCSQRVLDRSFYLFPCSHAFHAACMCNTVAPRLTPSEKRMVRDAQQELAALQAARERRESRNAMGEAAEAAAEEVQMVRVQAKLDALVAAECLLCGDLMIRTVDLPLEEDNVGSELDWAI